MKTAYEKVKGQKCRLVSIVLMNHVKMIVRVFVLCVCFDLNAVVVHVRE